MHLSDTNSEPLLPPKWLFVVSFSLSGKESLIGEGERALWMGLSRKAEVFECRKTELFFV